MKRWVLTSLAAAGVLAPAAQADSLWERRDPRYAFLFQDNRARQVGDILTIAVSETTVANDQDARTMQKSNSSSGTVNYSGSTGSRGATVREATLAATFNTAFNRQFNGTSALTTNHVLTDRMAVTVVDIMPNGNLVVEGYRSRVIEGEERVLRVTGVVRQQDVGIGNLVQSASVANLRLSYLGRGPETRTINQNYLGKIINVLWPW